MAPEQILCGEVDARTDQFSFCIALYEALDKERPFVGHTAAELFDSTLESRLPAAVAKYEYALSGALVMTVELRAGLAHAQRAVEIGDRLGLRDPTFVDSLVRVADLSTRMHRPKDALPLARRATELAEQLGDSPMLVKALTTQGGALLDAGDDAAARSALEQADARAAALEERAGVRADRRFLIARGCGRAIGPARATWRTRHAVTSRARSPRPTRPAPCCSPISPLSIAGSRCIADRGAHVHALPSMQHGDVLSGDASFLGLRDDGGRLSGRRCG